jgi:murein DD-endopeptidase MepM/ murein hydrolase activator NlpD
MRLEPVSGGWIVRVQNPLPAPAQVRLSMPAGAVYRAVPGLPAIFTLAPGEDRAVARIYVLEPDQARTLGLGLDVIPGPAGAHPEDAPYRLPFANVPVRIDQGFEGPVSHHDLANRYALDFALPVGTPVLAARAGRIIQVESGFHEGGTDPRLVALANQVRILHRDGSMALYGHLAADSVRVRSGEWVEAGAHLADSGDTGFSTGPHLHFVVQVNAGMRLAAIPFRMTGPLGELRFPTVQAVGPPEPQPLGPAAGAGARPGPL